METIEMSSKEQKSLQDFCLAIRFYMEPFRSQDLIISYEKNRVLGFDLYRLEIRLKGSSLVLTHQLSELAFESIGRPEMFAQALALEFSKKFREYRQDPGTNVVLGEN